MNNAKRQDCRTENKPKGKAFESGKRSVHHTVNNSPKGETFVYEQRVADGHPNKKKTAKNKTMFLPKIQRGT